MHHHRSLLLTVLLTAACQTFDAGPRSPGSAATVPTPDGRVDERLDHHRAQLTKLAGNDIVTVAVNSWRHRLERSRPSQETSLDGDAIGESAGVGGLGLRGTGAGGGGEGESIGLGTIGTIGTIGRGSGSGVVYEFSDDTIDGELLRPEAGHEARVGPDADQAAALRAGSSDDNEDFDAFLRFLGESTAVVIPDGAMSIDVSGRRFVHIIDVDGRPFPAAAIVVRDQRTEEVVATASTYGDGRAPFYPPTGSPQHWIVEASGGQQAVGATWDGDVRELTLQLPVRVPALATVPLDVLFLIDTTGSMGDEIDRIKETLLSMTAKVRQGGGRAVDLRYGAVLYRDVGDAYVTATHDFTADIDAFDAALRLVAADGGGDTPESLNQGLAEAMVGVSWREQAAKVAFLIGDAVPHMDYQDDIPYGESLKDAVTLGVRVHAVAASGLANDNAGSLVFRQIAQYARGHFIFIEYGQSITASALAHGVTTPVVANNLDDILLREIKREIDGWGL